MIDIGYKVWFYSPSERFLGKGVVEQIQECSDGDLIHLRVSETKVYYVPRYCVGLHKEAVIKTVSRQFRRRIEEAESSIRLSQMTIKSTRVMLDALKEAAQR